MGLLIFSSYSSVNDTTELIKLIFITRINSYNNNPLFFLYYNNYKNDYIISNT